MPKIRIPGLPDDLELSRTTELLRDYVAEERAADGAKHYMVAGWRHSGRIGDRDLTEEEAAFCWLALWWTP